MPVFRYAAKDKTGRSVSGVSESPDERSLVDLLRHQELTVISVKPDRKKESLASRLSRMGGGGPVKLGELVLFSRQLATMIDSGIPLMQGLEILTEQVESRPFKAVVAEVKRDVASGAGFHDALAKHPRTFSPLFLNMVKAGESSGALDDIMDRLATYLEKTDSLIRKVRSAMVYPVVVSLMAIGITLILMLKVVPVFKGIFLDFGGELPLATRALIVVSDFLTQSFFVWVPSAVVGGILLVRFLKTERGTFIFDRFKLRMPVFGMILRKVAVSKFARTLSTLLKSGVPILSALEIVAKTAGNSVIQNAVDKVRSSIREGENITDPLVRSGVFPPLVVRMISVGEQSGELEKMLSKIADFYDDQVDASVAGITSLIEPLVIAFLGIVIGGIVICMFLPIFQLSSLVNA
ncbi:MAG: type II secretion system F family protein [Candidatus Omnitrophica bacterium]|nr:type II secretion system F family protein [Candidatus Omnitrophota bacterium]